MIVYQATKSQFLRDTQTEDIDEIILEAFTHRFGHAVARNQVRAWKASLEAMAKVLTDVEIPANAGIAVEYTIPQTCKRVDLLITGKDAADGASAVIVELKQWETAALTAKDGIVETQLGGGVRETSHPSYQAWSYKMLLKDFNEAVEQGPISLEPCAYLHNYQPDEVIAHEHYRRYLEEAPVFLRGKAEREKLQAFIKRHVKYGDDLRVLYSIENGRIRPSKMLADSVRLMLKGNKEFLLVDEQKVVFETAVSLARIAQHGLKQVFVVEGGPGTGKSVVAINILARLLQREGEFAEQNCRYVSRNAAPRLVYQSKLTGERGATRLRNLFCGSGAFVDSEDAAFDTLIVDEAHRLNEKSGMYGNEGDHQIREIIRAARCSIFFIDEDQRVTWRDIGSRERLEAFAREAGATISTARLESQFRCNGSDGYLAWLDNTLGIRETANEKLDEGVFDFRVFDSPVELHTAIEERNRAKNRARVVAGYCWDWVSRHDPNAYDIEIPEFGYRRRWNLASDGSLWIIGKESVEQVGCIHTCQGLEVDYIGVIVGDDFIVRDHLPVCRAEKRSRHDQSVRGWRKAMKEDPGGTKRRLDAIIKNTYRTLMTRGMKGCYIYCSDPETAAYFRSRIGGHAEDAVGLSAAQPPRRDATVIPFKRRESKRPDAARRLVPVMDLKFAAGTFENFQIPGEGVTRFAELPDGVAPQEGLFIAQVQGESMNRVIPNGAWCLFRSNPQGTRVGKIVVAQHRRIEDPETGGSFTIKVYRSRKAPLASELSGNLEVTLEPDSKDPAFNPLRFGPEDADDLRIVAEFLRVVADPNASD